MRHFHRLSKEKEVEMLKAKPPHPPNIAG